MPWLTESKDSTTNTDNIWLKFGQLTNPGDSSEVKIRVLGGDPSAPNEPAGVWTHWVENRSYNCPGIENCPVCQARMKDKKIDPAGYKDKYPMNYKYYFNVLVVGDDPQTKIFSFGNGVGKILKSFAAKYGDLRDYDVTIQKTKMGRAVKNVEYSVFFEGKRPLTDQEEQAITLHDLNQYTAPASAEVLASVASGKPVNDTSFTTLSVSEILVDIEDECKKKGLESAHFGITPNTPRPMLESLLRDLRSE